MMNINDFFTRALGAHLKNPRWSWGAVDTFSDRVYLRVWQDQMDRDSPTERVMIGYPRQFRRSAGWGERNLQIALIESGAEGFGVICVAANPGTAGARKIKRFDDRNLVRLGRIVHEGEYTYAEIAGRVAVDDLSRSQTGESSLSHDLRAIARKALDATQKEVLINARVGQGRFRVDVLRRWGNRCAVTGSRVSDAIRASHIKPWRACTDKERLDPANGLPLIANLDALFDAGLISFDADGAMVVSEGMSESETSILLCGGHALRLRKPLAAGTALYLEFHRQEIFRATKPRSSHSRVVPVDSRRLGFLKGEITTPDDFDEMDANDISATSDADK